MFETLIREFLESSADIVHRHGGALATFLGDGVMAIFGGPATGNPADHSQQAALAALELADYFEQRVEAWSAQILSNAQGNAVPEEFGLGIGLHRDYALVGNLAVRGQGIVFTAVGRAPTIAARIQDMARAEDLMGSGLLPDVGLRMRRVVILSTLILRDRLREGIGLAPLKRTVQLKGVSGYFSLGLVHRG